MIPYIYPSEGKVVELQEKINGCVNHMTKTSVDNLDIAISEINKLLKEYKDALISIDNERQNDIDIPFFS